MIKRTLLFICLVFISTISAQQTLKELNSYAKDNIEYPTYDNKDLLNPDYSTFHKSQIKGFFGKTWDGLLRLVRIKNKPVGTMDDLKELLDKLSKDKKQGDFICKFTPKVGNKFVIFGDLHGAFHSLIRDLEKLKELKIIDDDLKISEDYYFVFNGNVIDRSPYIIETLCVVLYLIEKNPGKVFYLCGDHESKDKWRAKGLKREIEVKSKPLSDDERNSLIKKVDNYLNTLPIALFLKTTDQDEFVCFSHYSLGKNNLKQSFFAGFLAKDNSEQLKTFNLTVAEKTNGFVNIEAIIKGTGEHDTKVRSEGLTVLLPDRGATAWSIFSSPTMSSQKNYSFFYDSFSIVETGKDIYNWKISSYLQDVRTKKGFDNKSYYLVSTQSTNKPACDGKINIGSTMDLSAELASVCRKIYQGLFLPILNQNQKGGIKGKYLKLIVLNDTYEPTLAKKNIANLLGKYKTNIILSSQGTPTLKAYIDLVKSGKIIVLFPFTGGSEFRLPELSNIVHLRASFKDEGKALLWYATKILKLQKFVLFYQNDLSGLDLSRGAKKVLSKSKKTKFIEVEYLRGATDLEVATKKILKFDQDAILLFSSPLTSIELIRQLGIDNLAGKKIIGHSTVLGIQDFLKSKGLGLVYDSLVPDIKTSELEIVKKFNKQAKKKNFSLSEFSLEAFIDASIFVDILKMIEGPITKEKIISKIEKIKDYNFNGLKLNFNPQTRGLADNIWIVTENDKFTPWEGEK